MKNLIFGFVVLLFAQPICAQQFSLQDAIQYALNHHNDVKRNALNIEDADMRVKEYWATGLPTVTGDVSYQYFFELPTTILPSDFSPTGEASEIQFGTRNNLVAGIRAEALLFDGGFLVGLKAQRAYKELISSQIGQTQRDIRVNVIKAYLNVQVLEASKAILDSNITSITKTREETKALYENGFAEQLDVDRLELSVQNLQAETDNVVQLIEATKIILKFQMGFPMRELIQLTDDIDAIRAKRNVVPDLKLNSWDVDQRVEFGLLDQTIGLTDLYILAIKATYLPTLRANYSYNRSLQTDQLFGSGSKWFPSSIGGLNLAVPIYDAQDKSAKIGRAKIQREELLLQRDDLSRLVEMEARTSSVNLQNAINSLAQRERSQRLAEKIYNTTLIKYNEGVGSSLEVNQAELEMLNAQRIYIESLFNYLIAHVDFERAIGKI